MLQTRNPQLVQRPLRQPRNRSTQWATWSRSARVWLPIVLLPVPVVLFFPAEWPRWAFMWSLAFATYVGCKWLTWVYAPSAPRRRQLGYLLLWPGLDASAFLTTNSNARDEPVLVREWCLAAANLTCGLILLFAVARTVLSNSPYLVGWVGMIGIVLTLHFGLFHLLSCACRSLGINARPLMNWPLASVSVGEFWGRRWNTAFRDLTNRFLYRPLVSRYGKVVVLLAGFFISGLVHELVISVPAGAGYGMPTLYFLIQAMAILTSHTPMGRRIGLGRGRFGWAFTTLVVIGPAGLLFHRPFVDEVILPFMLVIGAL